MSKTAVKTRKAVIRKLNDKLRASLVAPGMRCTVNGRVLVAPGISELPPQEHSQILRQVARFDDFERANDPYFEHDFGAFDHGDEKVFFKIDYYDLELNGASPDSADDKVTTRVLTVMFAHEY